MMRIMLKYQKMHLEHLAIDNAYGQVRVIGPQDA